MNIEIRYTSRSGNTKKIAEAIGEQLGVTPQSVTVPLSEDVDILFLGSALYALQLDKNMLSFIDTLSPEAAKKVYCFSTTAVLTSSYGTLKKALSKQRIIPEKLEFHCKGQFGALHMGHPDNSDIKRAKSFAKKAVAAYKSSIA